MQRNQVNLNLYRAAYASVGVPNEFGDAVLLAA